MQQEVEYLGYLLTSDGIKPQQKKIEAIKRIKSPKNPKQLRSFLGLVNFYRDLWPKRSHTLGPLSKLSSCTPKNWVWGREQQKAFEKVDIDYCLETAKQSLNAGVKNLSLITSIGADSDSSNFYLRTKGIVENKISQLNFQSLSIHRPGLLIGPRKDMRLAEFIGQKLHPFINPLLFGKLSEFRCIKAKVLARAMIECSGLEDGISHYYYKDFVDKGDI